VTDYRDLRNRDFAQQRLREGRELEEQQEASARARRERIARAQREQCDTIDVLRNELRAEIDALRQESDQRYDVQMKAIGQVIGETANHMDDAITKVQNELFALVERRFGQLIGRIEVMVPGERGKDFKFADERDKGERDDDVMISPNPLPRRGLN
jgi:hypothetical protein